MIDYAHLRRTPLCRRPYRGARWGSPRRSRIRSPPVPRSVGSVAPLVITDACVVTLAFGADEDHPGQNSCRLVGRHEAAPGGALKEACGQVVEVGDGYSPAIGFVVTIHDDDALLVRNAHVVLWPAACIIAREALQIGRASCR